MLTEIYIEALLPNEVLADQVLEAWDADEIEGHFAVTCWALLVEFEVAVGDVDGIF